MSATLRSCLWAALAAAVVRAAPAVAGEGPAGPPGLRGGFPQANTADLPELCGADQLDYDVLQGPPWGPIVNARRFRQFMGGDTDPDELFVCVALTDNVLVNPYAVIPFVKALDYYRRRLTIQYKTEKRLEALTGAERSMALGNYAMALLYLGEFRKVLERFGPGSDRRGEYAGNGAVNFAVGQAYFRLGRYAESLPFLERAVDLLPELARDTRWQLMLSQLGLYGREFFGKFDVPGQTAEHARKLFPNADPSLLPFEDATEEAGLGGGALWGGSGMVSFADLDGDGWDDLVFERKYSPMRIFRNTGGRFEPVPRERYGPPACNSIVHALADFDNDGRPDLARTCCGFDGPGDASLLKNKGGFEFKDVSGVAGLRFRGDGMSLCWADYDLDGRLDLVMTDQTGPARLFRNRSDGTFQETSRQAGIVTPGRKGMPPVWGPLGCAWGDFNDDRYPDLFLQGWGFKRLFINNRDGTFQDATAKSGIDPEDGKNGHLAFAFDYDNDGRLDLLAGQYATLSKVEFGVSQLCTASNLFAPEGLSDQDFDGAPVLYRNAGDGAFERVPSVRFLPLGIEGYAHGDWDNDGDEDLVFGAGGPYLQQAEPFLFYRNDGDGAFANLTPFAMPALWGKGHGIALGDFDHDGDLDLALNAGGFAPGDAWPGRLLRNTGNSNHWLRVYLKPGPGTNRSAIGAKVKVYAGGRTQVKELDSGGPSGQSTLSLHFGLGPHRKVERLVVEWPNRRMTRTELRDVPADQAVVIRESAGTLSAGWAAP